MSKNLIDKLVEQMLLEKGLPKKINQSDFQDLMRKLNVPAGTLPHSKYDTTDEPNDKANAKLDKIANQIANQDADPENISTTDFKKVFSNPKKTAAPAVKVASQIARGTTDSDIKSDIQTTMPGKGSVATAQDATVTSQTPDEDADIESFSYPRPLTNLGNVNHGKFLGSQNALINSVFTLGTFKERIEELNKLGSDLLNTQEIAKMKPRELLQKTQVADLFDMLFNQQDQRSGGYFFETFLALLSGGKVVGGGNGAADFEVGGGQSGSSKFFEGWSNIKQSTDGWGKKESIHYVIGRTDKSERDETKAIEYMAVKMYYVVATNHGVMGGRSTNLFTLSDAGGNRIATDRINKGGTLYISDIAAADQFYIGEFRIIKGAGDSYKEALNNYVKSDPTANSSKALTAMKGFFQSLYKADESTKKYINSEGNTKQDQLKADAAFEGYDAADKHLVELMNLLQPATNPQYKERAKRQESLGSDLDQLIESIINKKLLK